MEQKEQLIHFLRHYRHDWLNHLQIIKAYLSMDKQDELSLFLDQLMIRAHQEAQLSQIGDSALSYFLLTYNWLQDKLQLEVEVEVENGEQLPKIGRNHPYLLTWLEQIMALFEKIGLPEDENRILILFSYQAHQLTICVDLPGAWNREMVQAQLSKIEKIVGQNKGKLKYHLHNQEQISFEIIV